MLDVDLMSPFDLSRPGDSGTNPEQLFAAGYAACFESALRLAARREGLPLRDAGITALVSLNTSEDKQYSLDVELHGRIDGVSREQGLALMQAAHAICPYSKATLGNIDVKLSVD
jgi:Ohr subfamily peroxiredoxin